jgi:hypothetical protein
MTSHSFRVRRADDVDAGDAGEVEGLRIFMRFRASFDYSRNVVHR